MRFIGDVLVVEHIGKNIESKIIHIPDDVRNELKPIKAIVVGIGEKFKYKDDVWTGDIVLVPEHLGSRNRIPDNPKAIVYDGDDVLAVFP